MSLKPGDLWTCPQCGHRFVSANIWHSCGHFDIDDHFRDKDPSVRELFERLAEHLNGFGPLTTYAQKTRIVFQVRTRFASVQVRKKWLILQLWLKWPADHPLIYRSEQYTRHDYGHLIRLSDRTEIDEALQDLLYQAYVMGSRQTQSSNLKK